MLQKYKLSFWVLHLFIAFAVYSSSATVLFWYGITLLISIWVLLSTKELALNLTVFMLYFAGMEMVIKLIGGSLPHEGIKYTCILLILIALNREKSPIRQYWPIGLALLLLLSIPIGIVEVDVERFRQLISANLSGPFLLLLGLFYYLRVPVFNHKQLGSILLAFILPSLVTTLLLFGVTPDVETISFSTSANFSASGYGPNQMSSALSIAATFILFSILYNYNIIPGKFLGVLLMGLIAYRIVLTFSRGGLFSLLILAIVMVFLYLRRSNVWFSRRLWIVSLFSFGLISGGVYLFNNVNAVTDGALENRLFDIQSADGTIDINDYTSGRSNIFLIDIEIFADNILGIGPGMGYYARKDYGYSINASAHVEYTRLLAEHGIFGLVVLFGLLRYAFKISLVKCNAHYKTIILIFLGTGMLFMTHSATRIAAPMVLFALTAAFQPKFQNDSKRLLENL